MATEVKVSEDKSEISDREFANYMNQLYDTSKITDEEIKSWNEVYGYKGFDRKKVLKDLMIKVRDVKDAQQIIMICGLLGPQRASLVKLINGRTIASYGIPASGMKGSSGVSCQRITAATADLCAYFLKKIDMQKRINLPLPGWLQFPSAGSIKLPGELREMHIEFSRRFSTVIGGVFNEQIYQQMMNNAYLDPKLALFDTPIIVTQDPNQPIPAPAPSFNPVRGNVGPPKTTASDRSSRA
jgi:hypothetical protein